MQTTSETGACPQCGQIAVITITERVGADNPTGGHSIILDCPNNCHVDSEQELINLWAIRRQHVSQASQ